MQRSATVVFILLFAVILAQGQHQPLWERDTPLQLVLETNFKKILKKVKTLDERMDGYLKYTDSAGINVAIPVQTEPRGHFRRDPGNCRFPPLSLKFPEKNSESVFKNITKLKLVTHCKRGKNGKHLVAKEFLCYRFFNVLTDSSFRVRPAFITYVDNQTRDTLETHFTFFIERTRDVRERLGTEQMENEYFNIKWLDDYQAARLSLFQFMIGNTDWSVYQEHNTKAMKIDHDRLAIPYDFDWSGFVGAPYARPHPKFPIKEVTQRHYIGKKIEPSTLKLVIEEFNIHQEAFTGLIDKNPVLDAKAKRKCKDYLESFYKIINDPKILDNYLEKD